MSMSQQTFDCVIVGGGLVGMSLASALAESAYKILLLEQNNTAPLHNNVLDLRTTGLTRSSEKVLTQAGLWDAIRAHVTPIERLDISEQGNFGGARIDANEHQLSPIGYMMPNDRLMSILSEHVSTQDNLTVWSPAKLEALTKREQGYQLTLDIDGQPQTVNANLLVGADGARSQVRQLLHMGFDYKDYQQTAIISIVRPEKAHNNIAYERFTAHGPLAVLPVQEQCCALIWTQPTQHSKNYLEMDDASFLNALQKAFGYRLGRFQAVGKRSAYPLSLTVSQTLTEADAVLIGNAAQSVHPVAAQGFNLGLRDVQTLVNCLASSNPAHADMNALLAEYRRARQKDRDHVIKLTDNLTRLFAPQATPIKAMRSIGLRMIANLPFAQRNVLRRNFGLRYL